VAVAFGECHSLTAWWSPLPRHDVLDHSAVHEDDVVALFDVEHGQVSNRRVADGENCGRTRPIVS
jgi:hypothetical protein